MAANLGSMIASVDFSGWDPSGEIIAVSMLFSFILATFGGLLWEGGRDHPDARSRWGRGLAAVCVQVGRIGVGLAGVLLVAGTWIGVKATSTDEANCSQEAWARGLKGSARSAFVRACIEDS
ncbi:MAG: hypothetical protein ACRDYF_17260 [Acidimicrobiia bacterium]